jgi:hypothetical protein
VQFLVLNGQRKSLNFFTGVMEPEDVGPWSNAHFGQRRSKPKMMEHMGRIGAYLETGSDLAQLGCLLEDRDIMPCLQKACSCSQSPDPGSSNDDLVFRDSTLLPIFILLADKLIHIVYTIAREPAMA